MTMHGKPESEATNSAGAATAACPACERQTPALPVNAALLHRLMENIWRPDPAPYLAAELVRQLHCSESDARTWAAHLLACPYTWPLFSEPDRAVLAQIDAAFASVPRPAHFTDAQQNACAVSYHDETLLARPRERLRREDLGQADWNPLRFTHAAAEAYLLPVLARYALMPRIGGHDAYAPLLIRHLDEGGPNNRLLAWCNPAQRQAVLALLQHLKATDLHPNDLNLSLTELSRAIEHWHGD